MAIRDNETGTTHHECAECGAPLVAPCVSDDQTRRVYCGARCHHIAFYGVVELTHAATMSWERVLAWEAKYRPQKSLKV